MAQNAIAARRRMLLRVGVGFDVVVVSPFITCLRVLDRSIGAMDAGSGGTRRPGEHRGPIIPGHSFNYKSI
jgi:hypothetical protein